MSSRRVKIESYTLLTRCKSRKGLVLLTALVLITLIYLLAFSTHERTNNILNASIAGKAGEVNLANPSLAVHELDNLAPSFHYAWCDFVVAESESNNQSTEHLEIPLPEFHFLQRDDLQGRPTPDSDPRPIIIQAPKPPKRPDASHIIFGTATTLKRLNESIDAFAHWAAQTNTRILAIIEPQPSADIKRLEEKAADLGVNLQITESDEDFDDRYFSLVKLLHDERKRTQWAAFIDDDTFFLSMSVLVDRLARYDSSQPYYIGSLSEDFV